jgi:hypothetical protein
MSEPAIAALPDGLVAFVKRDCPTCALVVPVLAQLRERGAPLAIYTQDDPAFPALLAPLDDTALDQSWQHRIETVPTLLRVEGGREAARAVGWSRAQWEALTGQVALGPALPPHRPGCGSLSADPVHADALRLRHGRAALKSRRVEFALLEDEHEALFARGWTDGLPVVPPTEARVLRMLGGTVRKPDEVVAVIPPDLVPATVEKIAVNAVMAGCLPEHLPVVLAAVEAACTDEFNMHGLLATTMPVGPVVIINGPVRRALGMNSGVNVLGQGNRAGMAIGRALQLVVRNLGGGRPGEVDRATHGSPGKLSVCFPEDEEGSPWEPLSVERGFRLGANTVTLFAGEGTRCVVDQQSRTPESLASSFSANLAALHHPKLAMAFDAILVVGPEHARIFREAGWSKARLLDELFTRLERPGDELVRGAGGIAEGVPGFFAGNAVPKFRPGGLLLVHAGGSAGLFSEIIGGWVNGAIGSQPVTREIT